MSVQITGSPNVIRQIIEGNFIPAARQHDRAGLCWLEVERLSDDDCVRVEAMDAKVHGDLVSQRASEQN